MASSSLTDQLKARFLMAAAIVRDYMRAVCGGWLRGACSANMITHRAMGSPA